MQTHYSWKWESKGISVTYTGCEQTEIAKLMLTFLWLSSRFFQQIRRLLGKLWLNSAEKVFLALFELYIQKSFTVKAKPMKPSIDNFAH